MRTVIVTLSDVGLERALEIIEAVPETALYVHESVTGTCDSAAGRFERMAEVTAEIWSEFEGIVFIAPCGAVVRCIASCIKHKKEDPAVVVVDVGGRYSVSLLSGHEGGANELAISVANILGAEPVISTTSEAVRNIIVGVGCRRGVDAEIVKDAVTAALKEAGVSVEEVRYIASVDIKSDENGIFEAASALGVPVRIIPSSEILRFDGAFKEYDVVREKTGLPAVAEPAAVLAGRRTELILQRKIHRGVTVALARERFSS